MKIRAVIVDLDRTLLRSDKTLSAYTEETLLRCGRAGIAVMIATARPQRTAEQFCARLRADAAVFSNGARILCRGARVEYAIRSDTARRLLGELRKHPSLRVTLETGDCAYSNLPVEDYETVPCEDLAERAAREGAIKILVHIDDARTPDLVQSLLSRDLHCTIAHGRLIQMMDARATKWNGVKAMLESYGIAPEEAAYFGDDNDDVESIRNSGMGVAVANGIGEALAAADYIAPDNDHDGAAAFIRQHLLAD